MNRRTALKRMGGLLVFTQFTGVFTPLEIERAAVTVGSYDLVIASRVTGRCQCGATRLPTGRFSARTSPVVCRCGSRIAANDKGGVDMVNWHFQSRGYEMGIEFKPDSFGEAGNQLGNLAFTTPDKLPADHTGKHHPLGGYQRPLRPPARYWQPGAPRRGDDEGRADLHPGDDGGPRQRHGAGGHRCGWPAEVVQGQRPRV